LKIGIVIGRFPPQATGGAEVQAMLTARLLASHNEVIVFTRRLDDSPFREARDGYTIVRTRAARLPLLRLLTDLIASRRAVGAERGGLDALLCFQTINSGVIGAVCKRSFGVPFAVWVRGQEEYRWAGGPERRLLVPRVLSSAERILVQSDRISGELRSAVERLRGSGFADLVARKVRVIPTMVEPARSKTSHGGTVLFVGRLVAVKGIDLLIEAMRRVDGAKLVVIGDGPLRRELERSAKGLPISFEGMLPHASVREWLSRASLLVQPSLAEGMPNTVLEAMAHGVPVIATDIAGVPEIVQDEVTGFLLRERDPALLASLISRLLSDAALWERVSDACIAKAEEYSPGRVFPRLVAVLEEVASEAPRKSSAGRFPSR